MQLTDELIDMIVGLTEAAVKLAEEDLITPPEAMRKICKSMQVMNRAMMSAKSSPAIAALLKMKTEGEQ